MYIRVGYKDLGDIIMNDGIQYCLVIGLKGIGKSMFLNYLLIRILAKYPHYSVLYIARNADVKRILFSNDVAQVIPESVIGGLTPDIVISDSVDIAMAFTSAQLHVLVASDNQDHYKAFQDICISEAGQRVTMKPWTYEELISMNPISTNFSEVESKFFLSP